jgi:hypothetical protein
MKRLLLALALLASPLLAEEKFALFNRAAPAPGGLTGCLVLSTSGAATLGCLAPGTSGYLLQSAGSGSPPSYVNPASLTVGALSSVLPENKGGAGLDISGYSTGLFLRQGISSGTPQVQTGILWGDASHVTIGMAPAGGLAVAHYLGMDTDDAVLYLDAVSAPTYSSGIVMRTSRVTGGVPSAIQSGDWLGALGFRGFATSAFADGSSARLVATATENWTNTAQGARIDIEVTPNGSTSAARASAASFTLATVTLTGALVSSNIPATSAAHAVFAGPTSGGAAAAAFRALVAADVPTLNQSTTGSAATLTTPRAINGVNFDGSAPITVTADANTLSGTTLKSTVVTSSLTSVGTLTGLTVSGDASANSLLKVNGFEFQPFTLNNGWFSDNIYYSSGFKYRATGYGTLFYLFNGDFEVRTVGSGTAGATATAVQHFRVAQNGDVGLGGEQTAGAITGSVLTVLDTGAVGVNNTNPPATFTVGGATTALNSSMQWSSGTTPLAVPGVIFTQTATATVSNTATETTLVSTGVGTVTLPANFLVAGRTIRVTVGGQYADANATGHSTTIRLKVGGTTFESGLSTASVASHDWSATAIFTCRTTGSSGTGIGVVYGGGSNVFGFPPVFISAGSITINTTGTLAIDATAQWSGTNVGESISATNVVIEALN